MKKTRTIATAAAGVLALALTACSSGGGSSADIAAKPDFSGSLSILTAGAGDPMSSYFEDLVADYKKQHPDVKITLAQETDDNAIKDKEKVLIGSQSLPDIYFSYAGNWGENFAENGLAADLSSVIAPGTAWGDTFGTGSVDAFKYGGKYYGVPLYNDAKFMGYNTKIFSDLGLDVPKTLEQLISDCSTIKAAGYVPIAFGNKDGWPGLHYLGQLFAYDVPRDALDDDLLPKTAKYTDQGYVEGMKQFQQLVTACTGDGSNSNGVTYTTAQQQQATGKAAMYYQELIEFDSVNTDDSQLHKDGFGIFPLPAPEAAAGDAKTLEAAPEGYMINQRSKNAALALDFLKFVTNEKNATTLSAPPYGQPSAVKDVVTEDIATPAVVEGTKLVNDAPSTVVWLDMANVPSVADAWVAASEGLVSGSLSPEDALASVRQASEKAK
ncbi:extracellular solute-binding protein [Leifsonia sp. F6_8S_P_1B]|uniref:Extracellular solute-binding protein n=1 Tax=Leifsonia williamsii TaxID=3035919 RepID=A0ABT8K9D6_9MICO|nr:extracellular solute-binding protein [Leifsonia williamsii]MDN4614060.1 extracellular solute-binding protein [Leifsonia williamsii]